MFQNRWQNCWSMDASICNTNGGSGFVDFVWQHAKKLFQLPHSSLIVLFLQFKCILAAQEQKARQHRSVSMRRACMNYNCESCHLETYSFHRKAPWFRLLYHSMKSFLFLCSIKELVGLEWPNEYGCIPVPVGWWWQGLCELTCHEWWGWKITGKDFPDLSYSQSSHELEAMGRWSCGYHESNDSTDGKVAESWATWSFLPCFPIGHWSTCNACNNVRGSGMAACWLLNCEKNHIAKHQQWWLLIIFFKLVPGHCPDVFQTYFKHIPDAFCTYSGCFLNDCWKISLQYVQQ
jgi:hypothetical protein